MVQLGQHKADNSLGDLLQQNENSKGIKMTNVLDEKTGSLTNCICNAQSQAVDEPELVAATAAVVGALDLLRIKRSTKYANRNQRLEAASAQALETRRVGLHDGSKHTDWRARHLH